MAEEIEDLPFECFMEDLYTEWVKYNNVRASVVLKYQDILLLLVEIDEASKRLQEITHHFHDRHFHQDFHTPRDLGPPVDPQETIQNVPPPVMYPAEAEFREDMDLDGKAFSTSFLIVDGPPVYKNFRYHPEYDIPDNVEWKTFEEVYNNTKADLDKPRLDRSDPNYDPKSDPGSSQYEPPVSELSNTSVINPESGLKETGIKAPLQRSENKIIERLILEFATAKDADGNNLIYNTDFVVPNDDPNKPKILKNTERYSNNPPRGAKRVSWNHFLSTLGLGVYAREEKIVPPGLLGSEIISNLTSEVLTGVDQDGDGLVYGKDFVIVGPSTPTELKSKYPPYLPEMMLSWDSYLAYAADQFAGQKTNDEYAGLLLDEYNEDNDFDNNGLKYGRDFIIDPNDPRIPKALIGVKPIAENFSRKTWTQYLKTLPTNPMDGGYYKAEELVVKLSTENETGEDIDGNGLVYGHDFIITDYTDEKTDCLWKIELDKTLAKDPEVLEKIVTAMKLPKAIKTEYTIEEFYNYWNYIKVNNNPPGTVEPDPIPDKIKVTQCIPIERQQYDSNGNPVFRFHKFVVSLTWADLLLLNGEVQ